MGGLSRGPRAEALLWGTTSKCLRSSRLIDIIQLEKDAATSLGQDFSQRLKVHEALFARMVDALSHIHREYQPEGNPLAQVQELQRRNLLLQAQTWRRMANLTTRLHRLALLPFAVRLPRIRTFSSPPKPTLLWSR